jgi:uncharacterized protein YecE (DUF72 family)
MTVLVGTSGWQYKDWKGTFYPPGHPQRGWLGDYARSFPTVEVNNAFYRLPESATFTAWRCETPQGFVFSVKASRYLTHIRRLRNPGEPVSRLMDRAAALGDKLGPVLLQLPPTLQIDLDALDETLAQFPPGTRVAVEFRHPSWYVEGAAELLSRRGAAFCLADSPWQRAPRWRTANWGYLRFHEGRSTPHPSYGRTALAGWARRIAEIYGDGADVYAYFNNDSNACAPFNAATFVRALRALGLTANPGWEAVRHQA